MHIFWLGGQGFRLNIAIKHIMNWFKATIIQSLNPKAMDHKTKLNDANIVKLGNILDDDVFDGAIDESQQWGEDGITTQ